MLSCTRRTVKRGFIVVFLLLFAVMTACSNGNSNKQSDSSGKSSGTPKSGGILKMAYIEDAQTFDPIMPLENGSIFKMLLIYDTLVKPTDNADAYEPALATDWEISPDAKTFVFNIRQGVKFHDGSPMTAVDVKFSIDRARSPDGNWNWLYTSIESVEVTGEYQVTIKTSEPYVPMLANLALFSAAIVPEKYVKEKGPEHLANNPIGTGPFIFDSWERNSKVILKKNPDYWVEGKPYLDGVEMYNVIEDATRMLKLRAGELDLVEGVPYSEIASVKADSSLNMHVDQLAGLRLLRINTTKEPLNDVKIRQAINYAVDRDAIIQAALHGYGTKLASYLPRIMYYDNNLEPYNYDLEKAKQLMAESSRPEGFKTTISISAGDTYDVQTAALMKESLMKIGIDAEILQLDGGVKGDRAANMEHDLDAIYVTSDVIDPDELTLYEVIPEGGTDSLRSGFNNERVKELSNQARGEMDETKRAALYAEIQKIVKDEAPFIILYEFPNTYGSRSYVKDFKAMVTGNFRLENVWFDK